MAGEDNHLSYREAGVDIDVQDEAIRRLRPLARSTHTAEVLGDIGAFGGLYRLAPRGLKDPVLVASTDGVGTKLKVAVLTGKHDTIGYDLVSHCVNDILVQGARPLFFLDYIATGRLEPAVVEAIVSGMARACRETGCALIGGELAEMGDLYRTGDYDIAGFIVGAVERDRLLTGSGIRKGDLILGLPSVGLHTNGYSLARKIFFERLGMTALSVVEELGGTVGDILLAPHRCYLGALGDLVEQRALNGLAHITGGGLTDNLPRILPADCQARIRRSTIPVLPVFRFLQEKGDVAPAEMWRTFNMGIGMVLVVSPSRNQNVTEHLRNLGETPVLIGRIDEGPKRVVYED